MSMLDVPNPRPVSGASSSISWNWGTHTAAVGGRVAEVAGHAGQQEPSGVA